jgi:cysteine-rich repeat protein
LGKATSTLSLADLNALQNCGLAVFKCVQPPLPAAKRSACLTGARASCAAKMDMIARARSRFHKAVSSACGGEPPQVPLPLIRSTVVLGFETLDQICGDQFGLDLDSLAGIEACVEFGGACSTEQALGVGMPRIGDLLAAEAVDTMGFAICIPPSHGNYEGLDNTEGAAAVRCQKSASAGGRRLLKQQITAGRQCVDGLFKCRLTRRGSASCGRVAGRCRARFASLTTARDKLATLVQRACRGLTPEALRGPLGIGFDQIAARCASLQVTPATDAGAIATCIARAYTCAGNAIVRRALPLVDGELEPFGLALDGDAFCAPPTSATTTPIIVRTPTPPAPTLTPGPAPTPFCGNHLLTLNEECDDGNTVSGDGCDANCTVTQCGNGILTPFEECDDGNKVDGDGCSSGCLLEGPRPTAGCGNHVIDAGEQCDDGSGNGTDSCCTAQCQLVDSDGDGLCDALDPCTLGVQVASATLSFTDPRGPTSPTQSFRRIKFFGESEPNFPVPPPLDPSANGLRFLVNDFLGTTVLDMQIGGGLYDSTSHRGWHPSDIENYWVFDDDSTTPRAGIFRARIQFNPFTKRIQFLVDGKNGFYDVTRANLPLVGTLVLDPMTADTGQCVEAKFPDNSGTHLPPSCSNALLAIRCKM